MIQRFLMIVILCSVSASMCLAKNNILFDEIAYSSEPHGVFYYTNKYIQAYPIADRGLYFIKLSTVAPTTVVVDLTNKAACFIKGLNPPSAQLTDEQYTLALRAITFSAANGNYCEGFMWASGGVQYLGLAQPNDTDFYVEISASNSPTTVKIKAALIEKSLLERRIVSMGSLFTPFLTKDIVFERAAYYPKSNGIRAFEANDDAGLLHVFNGSGWYKALPVCFSSDIDNRTQTLNVDTKRLLDKLTKSGIAQELVHDPVMASDERELVGYLLCTAQ